MNKRTVGRASKIVKDKRMNAQASGLIAEDGAHAETHDLNEHSAQEKE